MFSTRVMNVCRRSQGVDLVMEAGTVLGLVGESGCGKTTLGRCILRLTEPTSGEVVFQGKTVTRASGVELRELRRKMQIVFQDPYASLDPRWRIGDILEEPLRIHNIVPRGNRRQAVQRLLAMSVCLPTPPAATRTNSRADSARGWALHGRLQSSPSS